MISMLLDRNALGSSAIGLERLSKIAGDLTPVMDTIGAYLVSSTQRRFTTQTGPGGAPWKPSLRATLEGGQTLLDSGMLRASIASIAGRNQVEVGSNKIYAAIQQLGGTIHAKNVANLRFKIGSHWVSKPSVTLVPRPFIGFDAEDQKEVEAIVVADLDAAERGKGRS
jgi:phage virion morphogenesis protein